MVELSPAPASEVEVVAAPAAEVAGVVFLPILIRACIPAFTTSKLRNAENVASKTEREREREREREDKIEEDQQPYYLQPSPCASQYHHV